MERGRPLPGIARHDPLDGRRDKWRHERARLVAEKQEKECVVIRYFIDTEFIEDGETIDLISIGIVAEDGRELYLQSANFSAAGTSEWVRKNVFAHLVVCPHGPPTVNTTLFHHWKGQCTFSNDEKGIIGAYTDCPWRTREQIRRELLAFMDIEQYGKPELWGYFSAYDHVAFCQLFGTMMDLPKGWPMYTRDLKQWADMVGNPPLPEQGKGQHHALADARWNRDTYQFLLDYTYRNLARVSFTA